MDHNDNWVTLSSLKNSSLNSYVHQNHMGSFINNDSDLRLRLVFSCVEGTNKWFTGLLQSQGSRSLVLVCGRGIENKMIIEQLQKNQVDQHCHWWKFTESMLNLFLGCIIITKSSESLNTGHRTNWINNIPVQRLPEIRNHFLWSTHVPFWDHLDCKNSSPFPFPFLDLCSLGVVGVIQRISNAWGLL